jgi:hypothetical protein
LSFTTANNVIRSAAADGGVSGVLRFWPNGTAGKKNIQNDCVHWAVNGPTRNFTSCQWNGANTALNGIRFLFSSGNITSGNFRLYGVQRV